VANNQEVSAKVKEALELDARRRAPQSAMPTPG
jgi:hypothetical protein